MEGIIIIRGVTEFLKTEENVGVFVLLNFLKNKIKES